MSGQAATGFRQTPAFHALLLGAFAMAAAAVLALGDRATRDEIALRKAEDLQASLSQVLPPQFHDNDILKDAITIDGPGRVPLTVYRGMLDGRVSALAYQMVGRGYAGDIVVIIGIDIEGRILGTRVLSHAETPGLGDKIEAKKHDWILGFTGLSLSNPPEEEWKVKKDGGRFDQFSGATVTPRAVVAAIRQGLEFFAVHKNSLLKVEKDAN